MDAQITRVCLDVALGFEILHVSILSPSNMDPLLNKDKREGGRKT